ncbi:hypothetical protein L208DRAFT_1394425 [Tricholoma matsutake]|nr:hypothetical protein L208DRAFT_1394425 [Tricholoma matsutake 945]
MRKNPRELELECEKDKKTNVIERLVTFVWAGVGNQFQAIFSGKPPYSWQVDVNVRMTPLIS